MLGRSTQRYLSPLAREATFFETRLPNEDRNFSNSPAARHAMADGSLDPNQTFFGRTFNRKLKMRDTFTKLFPAYEQPFEPPQLVQIYFDTATFDEISRDVQNTMETQISVIGGTMGLFTGCLI